MNTKKLGKRITFDIAITNDLQIGMFARGDATNQDATIALEMLLDALQVAEIELGAITPIERHRDDPRIQAVHDLTHIHDH